MGHDSRRCRAFFFNDTATTEIYTLSLHDALPICETAAVTMGRWAWSSLFADLNNDGWQDLVVANGYLTNERTDDL